jgi:hypothetical protein
LQVESDDAIEQETTVVGEAGGTTDDDAESQSDSDA